MIFDWICQSPVITFCIQPYKLVPTVKDEAIVEVLTLVQVGDKGLIPGHKEEAMVAVEALDIIQLGQAGLGVAAKVVPPMQVRPVTAWSKESVSLRERRQDWRPREVPVPPL